MNIPEHLDRRLFELLPEKPALLAMDFDGVFTDDRVYVDEAGRELAACTRGDGMGVTLLRRAGFPVLVISTEPNPIVRARSEKLGVECVHGCADKTLEFRALLRDRKIDPAETIYVGNDVNDIGCLRTVGCGLVVADAHPLVRDVADGVLTRRGGKGAVREICELVLVRLGRDLLFNPSDRDGHGE